MATLSASLVLALCGAIPSEQLSTRQIRQHQTVAAALKDLGLADVQVASVQGALAAAEFEFKKARRGDQLRSVLVNGRLDQLTYRRNFASIWDVRRDGDRWLAKKRELEREQKVERVELKLEHSVWEAALAAGEHPEVAVALADVFAWDIDFYRDVQKGDVVRAVIEKNYAGGRLLGYGEVLAARYQGSSLGEKQIYRHVVGQGQVGYFDENGRSAKKNFLKSPLKFSQVTSRFGGRFHPILNRFGAHQGVDFAAAIGTPVWSVADGVVTKAGWDRGGGNRVCVRHSMGFESCYLHLSKIAVRAGERIEQKRVLGASGNTGLSTGPHLHFGLLRNGRWVDPLNQRFPRSEPLPPSAMANFLESISVRKSLLEAEAVAQLLKQ